MIQSIPPFEGLSLTFNVTEDCNLACKYCYEVDRKKNDLPIEYAQKFIDLMLDDPDPIGALGTKDEWMYDNGLIMDFIGGDALMRPELCDKIISHFIWASQMRDHKWKNRWRASLSPRTGHT